MSSDFILFRRKIGDVLLLLPNICEQFFITFLFIYFLSFIDPEPQEISEQMSKLLVFRCVRIVVYIQTVTDKVVDWEQIRKQRHTDQLKKKKDEHTHDFVCLILLWFLRLSLSGGIELRRDVVRSILVKHKSFVCTTLDKTKQINNYIEVKNIWKSKNVLKSLTSFYIE